MTHESTNGAIHTTHTSTKPLQNHTPHPHPRDHSKPIATDVNDQSSKAALNASTPRRERIENNNNRLNASIGQQQHDNQQHDNQSLLNLFPMNSSPTTESEMERIQLSTDEIQNSNIGVDDDVTEKIRLVTVNGHHSSTSLQPLSSSSSDEDYNQNGIHAQPVITEEQRLSSSQLLHSQRVQIISSAVRSILDCLDDDPCRSGLQKTPERYAKALLSLTEGYSQTADQLVNNAKFEETPSESVIVRNIDVFSLCEHHLLPFHGRCHVAYIPNTHVIGLSKVARIVNMYARRLQVQERLTAQIADAILQVTQAHGVMVLISCTHMCMSMRGVEKVSAQTSTTATRGRYAKDPHFRAEFLATVSCPPNL